MKIQDLLDDPFEVMPYQEKLIKTITEGPKTQKVFVTMSRSNSLNWKNFYKALIEGESNEEMHDQLDISKFCRDRVLPARRGNWSGYE